jgi:hypothetical protein
MQFSRTLYKGDGVRERIAYLFMIGVLIMLIAVTFGVLGKGHYQPPKAEIVVSFPVILA